MPIYEYYSPDTNKIYSFFAKTLAQGQRIPRCPDNPRARMVKLVSAFAIGGKRKEESDRGPDTPATPDRADDPGMDAMMTEMERDFANIDENDPRAMARMMRRMAELSGEKLDEPMEEAVRKLEEGADPDSLEEQLGDVFGDESGAGDPSGDPGVPAAGQPRTPKEPRPRFRVRRAPPMRDPKLYDYD